MTYYKYNLILLGLFITSINITIADERLHDAALYAVKISNNQLVDALLQAGLDVNEALDENGWTLLHYAVILNKRHVAENIISNGANFDVIDNHSKRPIDYAFEYKNTKMCELLAKFDEDEKLIDDFPEEMITTLISDIPLYEDLYFVELNSKEPSDQMLTLLMNYIQNVKRSSDSYRMTEKEYDESQNKGSLYKDKATGQFGHYITIKLNRIQPNKYKWDLLISSGVTGSDSSGLMVKKYGYWIKIEEW